MSGGNVLMGKNTPCKLVSIGSIQIKMHYEIIGTLIEVRHIAWLKKNLVFMGAMDSKGFSCWVEGGIMKIKWKGKSEVSRGPSEAICTSFKGPLWQDLSQLFHKLGATRPMTRPMIILCGI